MINNESMTDDKILQNLKDANCSQDFIEKFIHAGKEAKTKLLAKHRKLLLNELHINQKRIDCLDYLIFTLKNEIA